MIKISLVALGLVGVALAYEHHGYINEVKHIPYKYYGGIEEVKHIPYKYYGGLEEGIGGGISEGFGGSQGGYKEESGLDYYSYPKYKFEYGVKDYKTGDHKSQWEMRDGDVVKGEYTLDEADGTKRIVEYYADSKTGFDAKVKNIGHPIEKGIEGSEGGIGGGYGHGYSYSKLKKYN